MITYFVDGLGASSCLMNGGSDNARFSTLGLSVDDSVDFRVRSAGHNEGASNIGGLDGGGDDMCRKARRRTCTHGLGDSYNLCVRGTCHIGSARSRWALKGGRDESA